MKDYGYLREIADKAYRNGDIDALQSMNEYLEDDKSESGVTLYRYTQSLINDYYKDWII